MDYKALLLSANGRIGRKTFWFTLIALMVVNGVAWAIAGTVAAMTASPDGIGVIGTVSMILAGIISLLSIWSLIALAFKRCHDRDMSGWMQLIPLYNVWVQIQMLFLAGTPGPNRFGADPLSGPVLAYSAA